MRGFPKVIQTKQDIYNCLALVKNGEFNKEDLIFHLDSIDNMSYNKIPILSILADSKCVVVNYCPEISTDSEVYLGDAIIVKIVSVEHDQILPNQMDSENSTKTRIYIDELPKAGQTETYLKVRKDYNEYMRLSITKEEIDVIRRELL